MRTVRSLILFAALSLTFHIAAESQPLQATDIPLNLRGATGELLERLQAYQHPLETFDYTLVPLADEDDLRVSLLTFPSPMKTPFAINDIIPGELYMPKHPAIGPDGKMPAAIVLDILDGGAILPRMTARVLANRGVAALYFPMPYSNKRRPPQNGHFKLLDENPRKYVAPPMQQAVMDVRRAKAILLSRPEIDSKRIGITGISLGGIMTSLAAGVDGDFYRVAPMLAGGDLATIVFHAREMHGLRAILEKHGIDRDSAKLMLATVEPINFASRIDPRTCLMINASQDEVIPNACTLALKKAMGDPTSLWVPTGHYSCISFLPNTQQRVADFLLGQDVTTLEFTAGDAKRPAK